MAQSKDYQPLCSRKVEIGRYEPYGTLRTAGAAIAVSFRFFSSVAAVVLAIGCTTKAGAAVTGTPFGTSPEGQKIEIFTLKNGKGMEARIMTWGGTLVSLLAPDVKGHYG